MMRNTDAHLPDDQLYMQYYTNPNSNPYMPATRCDPLAPTPPMEPAASQGYILPYMHHSPKLPSPVSSAGTTGGGGGGGGGHKSHHSQQSRSHSSMNHHHHHQPHLSHHQQQQQQQQAYTHPMSPLASMSSIASGGGGMLGSPPPMIDSSSVIGMNPGSPYMKMPSQHQLPPQSHSPALSSSSGHYDTPPPMPRYGPQVPMGGGGGSSQQQHQQHQQQLLHQQHQHLHSPSPVGELANSHHYGGSASVAPSAASTALKYCTATDSNESVNISTSLTHISETTPGSGSSDSSSHQHNYAPTPPLSQHQQQQQMNLSPVNSNGHNNNGSNGNGNSNNSHNSNMMASSSQGYSHSVGCNPISSNNSHHNWNQQQQQQQQMVVVGGDSSALQNSTTLNHHSSPNHTSAFSARGGGDAHHQPFSYHPVTVGGGDYRHSITSTPVCSQPGSQQDPSHYLMRQKAVAALHLNHSSINNSPAPNNQAGGGGNGGDTSTSFNVSETPKLPISSKLQQQQQLQQSTSTADVECKNGAEEASAAAAAANPSGSTKGLITAEKRSVVIFKVVEQIIDPSTKNILKEIVLKNEEVVSSLGKVQFDLLQSSSSGAHPTDSVCSSLVSSHAITTPSQVGSSGVLGDISGFSATGNTTKSLLGSTFETSTNTTIPATATVTKEEGTTTAAAVKTVVSTGVEADEQTNSSTNDGGGGGGSNDANDSSPSENAAGENDDDEEEERRRTARALLELHSVNNTPPKKVVAVEASAAATTEATATVAAAAAASESGIFSVLTAAAALSETLGTGDTVAPTSATTINTNTSSTSRTQTAAAISAPALATSTRRTTDRNNNDTTTTTRTYLELPSAAAQAAAPAPPPPLPTLGPLKAGLKVMAKWKNRYFYPAELLRQLEPHRWAVKFEDAATRNLFDTELIRLELLTAGQEVMLAHSDGLCILASIKKVAGGGSGGSSSSRSSHHHHHSSHRGVEVELVYDEQSSAAAANNNAAATSTSSKRSAGSSGSKRHKLSDVFLTAEQGSAILARSRPASGLAGGAVFADVDLDNIVVGKRSRKLQGTTAAAAEGKAAPSPAASSSSTAAAAAASAPAPEKTSSKEAKKRSSATAAAAPPSSEVAATAAAAAASDSDASASNGGGGITRKRRRVAPTRLADEKSKSSPPAAAAAAATPSPPLPSPKTAAAAAETSSSSTPPPSETGTAEEQKENSAETMEDDDGEEEEEEAAVAASSPKSLPLSPQLSARPSLRVDIAPEVLKGPIPVLGGGGGGLRGGYHCEKSLAVSPRTSRSTSVALSMAAGELEKILGPVPTAVNKSAAAAAAANGSTSSSSTSAKGLFEGICFMLTSGDRYRNGGNGGGGSFRRRGSGGALGGGGGGGGGGGSGSGSGGESSGSEQSGHLLQSVAERSVPFDKLYLTRQIQAGGGTISDTFEEMKASGETDRVLIADTYHRSVKYIQCLAAGIPIYSHLWIIDSCKAGQLLQRDSYLLPAGFSIITHSLSADKSTFKKSAILFRGMKFYFGSRMASNLEKLWSPVLMAAGSIIVKQDEEMHEKLTRKLVDIIISDATCHEELVVRAKCQRVPLVTSEYIVQCLINGRKLPFESAKCFFYDHTCTSLCEPM